MHGEEARQLARWVITQAIRDGGVARDYSSNTISQLVQDEARSFLLSSTGEWKRSREFWCGIADLDAEELRRRSMSRLGLDKEPEAQPTAVIAQPTPKPRAPYGPRPGTKLAMLVELLGSPAGTTLDEMEERFGWSRVTCSTAISGDLPHKFGIRSKRGPDGRYRLVQAA
jgi:hypothetical protein